MVEILHRLQLCITYPHTYMQKNSPLSGTGVIENACLSVWAKSAVSFEQDDGFG